MTAANAHSQAQPHALAHARPSGPIPQAEEMIARIPKTNVSNQSTLFLSIHTPKRSMLMSTQCRTSSWSVVGSIAPFRCSLGWAARLLGIRCYLSSDKLPIRTYGGNPARPVGGLTAWQKRMIRLGRAAHCSALLCCRALLHAAVCCSALLGIAVYSVYCYYT